MAGFPLYVDDVDRFMILFSGVTGFEQPDDGVIALLFALRNLCFRGFEIKSGFRMEFSESGDLNEAHGLERALYISLFSFSLVMFSFTSGSAAGETSSPAKSSTSLILFSEGTFGICLLILCDARELSMWTSGALWMIWNEPASVWADHHRHVELAYVVGSQYRVLYWMWACQTLKEEQAQLLMKCLGYVLAGVTSLGLKPHGLGCF